MFNNSSCEENCTEYRCGVPPEIPASLGIPESISLIQGVIAVFCALVGLPMNLYLLVIIIKFKSLHQRSLLLMLQVIAVEILYLVVIPGPVIFTSAVSGTWLFGEAMCNITGMIHDGFLALRFYFTLALTLDRFALTFWPFFYSKHGRAIAGSLMGAMWAIILMRIIVPAYGVLDCYIYSPYTKVCALNVGCSPSCENFIRVYTSFTTSAVLFAFILYLTIIFKMRRVAKNHSTISLQNSENVSRNAQLLYFRMHKSKKTLLVLLLIVTTAGTTPAAFFYILSTAIYKKPTAALAVGNMLVGQTLFNMIPVLDAISLAAHKDIRLVSSKVLQSLRSHNNE